MVNVYALSEQSSQKVLISVQIKRGMSSAALKTTRFSVRLGHRGTGCVGEGKGRGGATTFLWPNSISVN